VAQATDAEWNPDYLKWVRSLKVAETLSGTAAAAAVAETWGQQAAGISGDFSEFLDWISGKKTAPPSSPRQAAFTLLPRTEVRIGRQQEDSLQLIPHRSTENFSEQIRWSVDLRWQRPGEPSGFEAVQECILMRTARDPTYQIDWTHWAKQNRIADALDQKPADPFDPTVTGPWLHRWAEAPGRAVKD
jgi:hypothetical protein